MAPDMDSVERRMKHRRLADAGTPQREIAEQTGCSTATVNRDLKMTKPPVRRTPGGAPDYGPGRFDEDPDFQERVRELAVDMPELNARRQAAREFAGPPAHTRIHGQPDLIRTEAEKQEILAQTNLTEE